MDFDKYIKCIRSSLKAPKVFFFKRQTKDMRINLFNEGILLDCKGNLDIQIVLEPYCCASYIYLTTFLTPTFLCLYFLDNYSFKFKNTLESV